MQPLSEELLRYSVPTSEIDYAAQVTVEAVYVDFALLWTVFGVTVAITITSTVCCFCIFFVVSVSSWHFSCLKSQMFVVSRISFQVSTAGTVTLESAKAASEEIREG